MVCAFVLSDGQAPQGWQGPLHCCQVFSCPQTHRQQISLTLHNCHKRPTATLRLTLKTHFRPRCSFCSCSKQTLNKTDDMDLEDLHFLSLGDYRCQQNQRKTDTTGSFCIQNSNIDDVAKGVWRCYCLPVLGIGYDVAEKKAVLVFCSGSKLFNWSITLDYSEYHILKSKLCFVFLREIIAAFAVCWPSQRSTVWNMSVLLTPYASAALRNWETCSICLKAMPEFWIFFTGFSPTNRLFTSWHRIWGDENDERGEDVERKRNPPIQRPVHANVWHETGCCMTLKSFFLWWSNFLNAYI